MTSQALQQVAPRAADISTADGPHKAVVFGTLGSRTVVRWEDGPRVGSLGWVPPEAVFLPAQRVHASDPRLRCTARPAVRRG